MDYFNFIQKKQNISMPTGIDNPPEINDKLFPFQRDIVRWSLKRGCSAIFADCGMGKTAMQLEWADKVSKHTGGNVIILAPLAVAQQTVREGEKFGIDVSYCRKQEQAKKGITIANYEMAEHFDPSCFSGVVLDESSILKSYTGKFKNYMLNEWGKLQFRLACTATPAPNDFMELGNHSEFLGVMRGSEMLASFFINDPGNVGKYRIKGHAQTPFWKWMASWSVMIRKPSDLGYPDGRFTLPRLHINEVIVDSNEVPDGMLFQVEAHTMEERRNARRASITDRVKAVADMANGNDAQWLVWCDLNSESEQLAKSISGAVEVRGSDDAEEKANRLNGFALGKYRVLVTKPSIAGYGMNFQRCSHMAFTGLSDSYEQFYQAVRRCWRFGQNEEVKCYVITASTEGAVVANIKRKENQAQQLADGMVRHMSYISRDEIQKTNAFATKYNAQIKMEVPSWMQ